MSQPWLQLSFSVHPLTSVKLFLTDLLFSSPRLRFSVPQKKAVLEWASLLGAQDVPTFYALSQSQEYIKGLIGNSVTAVTTGTGHKIFMQDIPYMIVKVRLVFKSTHTH